jgi:DNA replication protein DnaC
MTTPLNSELQQRALVLKLYGLVAHWDELSKEQLAWVASWLQWEEVERAQRGLQRRLSNAHIGRFKPLADFDWHWPTQIDKGAISQLMNLGFINETSNIILIGSNGLGKSMVAQNITHEAVMQGHTALYVNAAEMLGDLASQDGDNALRRRLKYYAHPSLLVIDELGYLSYGDRHADLLFEIVNRRYEKKPIILTTNKPFSEWASMFPNNGSVVSIVDRLVHHSEILVIEGESYRVREARNRANSKKRTRTKVTKKPKPKGSTS